MSPLPPRWVIDCSGSGLVGWLKTFCFAKTFLNFSRNKHIESVVQKYKSPMRIFREYALNIHKCSTGNRKRMIIAPPCGAAYKGRPRIGVLFLMDWGSIGWVWKGHDEMQPYRFYILSVLFQSGTFCFSWTVYANGVVIGACTYSFFELFMSSPIFPVLSATSNISLLLHSSYWYAEWCSYLKLEF